MAKGALTSSSIAMKVAMALSALFLIIFLTQHFLINVMSIFSAITFNELSHFMGYNPLVQYVAQPILFIGVIFHFVMGFVLELQNRRARNSKYAKYAGKENSSWMSRNMIWSGLTILAFLGLHFYDFWIHEINVKYIDVQTPDPSRYYYELNEKFHDMWRVALYVISFVFLALHLKHGFQSAFQSLGARGKFTQFIKSFGNAYSILISIGFIAIALYHHFNQLLTTN